MPVASAGGRSEFCDWNTAIQKGNPTAHCSWVWSGVLLPALSEAGQCTLKFKKKKKKGHTAININGRIVCGTYFILGLFSWLLKKHVAFPSPHTSLDGLSSGDRWGRSCVHDCVTSRSWGPSVEFLGLWARFLCVADHSPPALQSRCYKPASHHSRHTVQAGHLHMKHLS